MLRPILRSLRLAALAAWPSAAAVAQEEPPARALLRELTSTTRLAGTVGSLRGAEIVRRHLAAAGWEVEYDDRAVVLSLPETLHLSIFESSDAARPVHERWESFDPDAVPPGDVPPFSAWSASGEVRGPVVDVGHGTREELELLRAADVELAGAIALCRYGGEYRGIKVQRAAELGCAGVLLYSHTEDDGAARGEVWPGGPWKPADEAQRGSISPIDRAPGDPSTPGFPSPPAGAAAAGRLRLAGEHLDALLPAIPCMPIGWAEAELVQQRLRARRLLDADGQRRGMRVGPGPVEVELAVEAPREVRTIRNVIARLAGARPQTVVAGNHRDAWVRGASDAGSGTVALLRAAQRLGERSRAGWRPNLTITLAFWDAEELGLIGSTEWAEAHADWLRTSCIAYVNADAAVSGTRFWASGTPGLETALASALRAVPAGDAGTDTLLDAWLAAAGGAPTLGLPGSGSDFAVFLHHLALPVLDLGFDGNPGGQYHTAFDDFAQTDRYLDPGFRGHELAGALIAELLARLATAGPLAFDEAHAAREIARHAREAAEWLGAADAERLAAAFDSLAGSAPDEGPYGAAALDAFDARVAALEGAGDDPALEAALSAAASGAGLYAALARDGGLPGRPWFRHTLWAPDVEEGYGAETFPLLRGAGRAQEVAALIAAVAELAARPGRGSR